MKDMPDWPKPSTFNLPRDYERARADAAMARLRVAVEALERYAANDRIGLNAALALAAIGPLPTD